MSVSVQRAFDEVITLFSRWDVGASGACTKAANCPGTGFASVTAGDAGKFTITFTRGIPVGPLVEARVNVWKVADAESVVARVTEDGFTAETDAAAATLTFEVWDIDETQAQVDPASGDTVTIACTFLKSK